MSEVGKNLSIEKSNELDHIRTVLLAERQTSLSEFRSRFNRRKQTEIQELRSVFMIYISLLLFVGRKKLEKDNCEEIEKAKGCLCS